jgi:hypothetical protein
MTHRHYGVRETKPATNRGQALAGAMERERLHLGHRGPNDRSGCRALWGK